MVVLDPRNGGVVAMASYPTYDPVEFVNGISESRYAQLVGGAETDNPLINRAIQGQYAPGSTFKPITAYGAMTKGLITANTYYTDNKVYEIPGGEPFNSPRAHGSVNVPQALTVSSDVYFYWIGHNFYRQRDTLGNGLQDTARAFGLGATSGIPLVGEQTGLIIDPDTKLRLHEENPDGFPYADWLQQHLIAIEQWRRADRVVALLHDRCADPCAAGVVAITGREERAARGDRRGR